jgi:hypothetical protein
MNHTEKSNQLAINAAVLVQVLMGDAPGDVEFVPLKPRMASSTMLADIKARWPGRGLRVVGLIGLSSDMKPLSSFNEPLTPQQVDALSTAFLTYVHVLLGESFAQQHEATEVQELWRLYSLPDTRIN